MDELETQRRFADELKIQRLLADVGIKVDSIYDLVNTKRSYPEAIPILISLLEDETVLDDRIREGVIRALAVKEAKGLAGSVLIKEFYRIPRDKMMLRWAIGSTLEVVITGENLDDVIEIVQDKQNGISRQMFVFALGKFNLPIVKETLIRLLDDDDVTIHALNALRKLKVKEAINQIKKLFDHSNKTVRELSKDVAEYLGKLP